MSVTAPTGTPYTLLERCIYAELRWIDCALEHSRAIGRLRAAEFSLRAASADDNDAAYWRAVTLRANALDRVTVTWQMVADAKFLLALRKSALRQSALRQAKPPRRARQRSWRSERV